MEKKNLSVEAEKTNAGETGKKSIKAARFPLRCLLLKIVLAAVLLCAIGAGAYFGRKKITEIKLAKKYMRIERQLVLCRELVTVKLRYSEIVSIKKAVRSALQSNTVRESLPLVEHGFGRKIYFPKRQPVL